MTLYVVSVLVSHIRLNAHLMGVNIRVQVFSEWAFIGLQGTN